MVSTEDQAGADRPPRLGIFRSLGPGLISGASDDDPSGIAAYAQAGAMLGYAACWIMLLCYPMMVTTQEISARIGRATGRGVIGIIARHYPRWLLDSIVALVVFANVVNLGADLGAMGSVLHMLIGGPEHLYVVLFGIASVALLMLLTFDRYVGFVKWMTFSLFAYFATAFTVPLPWGQIAYHTFVPELPHDAPSIAVFVAVMGTTISPYLFIWQASLEAERARGLPKLRRFGPNAALAGAEVNRIRIDTFIGMAVATLIAYAVIVTTAATLHGMSSSGLLTAAMVADALRPATGPLAELLFALGILGTGMLAVPMLAGSAAYALAEARGWPVGIARAPREARAFNLFILIATMAGVAMNFAHINAILALLLSAVINGVMAVPVLVMMMLVARRPGIMGQLVLPKRIEILGWITTAIMGATLVGLLSTLTS
ncbi:MAG TPA: divalent metal cation transporter [Aliidongia sp.]|nr:divalent metal cation transporter [Aliidongia sp.]